MCLCTFKYLPVSFEKNKLNYYEFISTSLPHTHTHTHTHTDVHTDTHKHRQTDRDTHTHTQTDTQRHTHTLLNQDQQGTYNHL